MELIAVVMKAPTTAQRFSDAQTLLDYGFASWALLEIHPDAPLSPIPVLLGKKDQIQPLYPQPCRLLVEKQARSEVSTRLELCENVQAPVEQGQILGRLQVYVGDELRTTIPLTAAEAIPRLTPGEIMLRLMQQLLMSK
jgi:D-alanyl-D-alanine carboxypeptidase (penicillin-binding protein 5/6)